MDHQDQEKGMSFVVAIVDRGLGESVVTRFEKFGLLFHSICLGRGTADSEILDYLGFGETEKDIVLSSVDTKRSLDVLQDLKQQFRMNQQGNGIAFTIPMKSVGGPITLEFLSGLWEKETME